MATYTTDFPTTSAPRTRADRMADGVIAGYINALAASSTQPAPAQVTNSSARTDTALVAAPEQAGVETADAPMHIQATRGPSGVGSTRRHGSWNRGRRIAPNFRVPCGFQPC
jgi:hypothetical protein